MDFVMAFAWLIMTGLSYRLLDARFRQIEDKSCSSYRKPCSSKPLGPICVSHAGVQVLWAFASLAWPALLPVVIGVKVASFDRASMLEKKQARELSAAKHEAEVAYQKRIAAEELDRELRLSKPLTSVR